MRSNKFHGRLAMLDFRHDLRMKAGFVAKLHHLIVGVRTAARVRKMNFSFVRSDRSPPQHKGTSSQKPEFKPRISRISLIANGVVKRLFTEMAGSEGYRISLYLLPSVLSVVLRDSGFQVESSPDPITENIRCASQLHDGVVVFASLTGYEENNSMATAWIEWPASRFGGFEKHAPWPDTEMRAVNQAAGVCKPVPQLPRPGPRMRAAAVTLMVSVLAVPVVEASATPLS